MSRKIRVMHDNRKELGPSREQLEFGGNRTSRWRSPSWAWMKKAAEGTRARLELAYRSARGKDWNRPTDRYPPSELQRLIRRAKEEIRKGGADYACISWELRWPYYEGTGGVLGRGFHSDTLISFEVDE